MGGEGARCRRGQGALTSPARHSRGSRLHVPRASPARSTSLRRGRARPRTRLPRSLLCSRPREAHFDGSGSRLSGGQSASTPLPPPTPSELREGRPFSLPTWSRPPALGSQVVQGACAAVLSTFRGAEVALFLVLRAARGCRVGDSCGAVGNPGLCWGSSVRRLPPFLPVGRFR